MTERKLCISNKNASFRIGHMSRLCKSRSKVSDTAARTESVAECRNPDHPDRLIRRRCLGSPVPSTLQTLRCLPSPVWNAWKDAEGHWLQSFAIVTTVANELMASIHERMPMILRPTDYDRWLTRGIPEQPPVDLLRPYDAAEMEMTPANPAVGNVRNNGPEMLVCPADVSSTGLWE